MDCTICISELKEPDTDVCTLEPCHHRFHSICIHTWLMEHPTCPTCRTGVTQCDHGSIWDHPSSVIRSVMEPLIESYRKQLVAKDQVITELEDVNTAWTLQQEERSYYAITTHINLVDLLSRTRSPPVINDEHSNH